jgi:two-component system, NarL family, nitrate/nitrite response regulator NarL
MQILVVDDHPAISTGLARYLKEIEPDIPDQAPLHIAAVTTLTEALAKVGSDSPPDMVFLDLTLADDTSGAATFKRLQDGNSCNVPVVIYTGLDLRASGTADTLLKCYKLGAHSIILKSEMEDTVLLGLPRLLAGERWIPQNIQDALIDWAGSAPEPVHLTPTQKKVAERLARGWPDKRIANDMGKSKDYIRQVCGAIYEKLGVRTRLGAALKMRDIGLALTDE